MKKIKLLSEAFSIPEIIIVILIIAIVATTMMTTLRPGANQHVLKKLYYNAYRSLRTGAYNIQADVEDKNSLLAEEKEQAGLEPPTEEEMEKFPQSQADLCKKLAETENGYLNISGELTCENTVDPHSVQQFKDKTHEELKEMSTFTASNGMMYFMSPMDGDGNTIVWVDLNGSRKPNTAEWKKANPADIVPFLISNTGVVVPLGYPTYDIRYLTARVTYSNPDEQYNRDSKLMSFYSAKYAAFQGKYYPLDAMSIEDPTQFATEDIKAMIGTPSADSGCPARDISEFPSCSVKVQTQDLLESN